MSEVPLYQHREMVLRFGEKEGEGEREGGREGVGIDHPAGFKQSC